MTDQQRKRRTVGERFRRFLSTAEQLEAEDLADQAREAGAVPLSECASRQKVTVRGTITSVTASNTSWLEADLTDGTGTVSLIWMGRRRLECIIPGRHVIVSGRLTEEEGRRVIFNPEFEVLS
ncbi:OB-fold nucleic acid binding domain-containing protein [Tessaracoccus antarcticus]|uniref:DNA-binding protein n=1 Tax=Tessaracoccus antarcticus TaxID=2479848 RepID=A0A3M0G6G5_9ACTN|nr:OB-fold nucleic acid binding domain-containing protein [Tessaracoccus antarcticus]RMB60088.1 DNA-binding protein [Tessaracoccus antarcticus]